MRFTPIRPLGLSLALVGLIALASAAASESPPIALEWEALMPADWHPETLFEGYDLETLEDGDPRAEELMQKLDAMWAEAPMVEEMDGQRIRIAGFVVPLDTDGEKIGEFILVPYFGACVHSPPPPPNQTIYVQTEPDGEYRGELFDAVWVSGTMRVESTTSDVADSGYRLEATKIEPYH
jgi:hypothetical protein